MLFCFLISEIFAQNVPDASLNIGDPSPNLYVRDWIKGMPVRQIEKGRVYVIEFWATWCQPCIASMPDLSALALKYKDRITVIGVNVYEDKGTTTEKIKAFVDSMGDRMNYRVAVDHDNRMVEEWLGRSGEKENGIPRSFVVNADGVLAWIGHPNDLAVVLSKVIADEWDIEQELKKRNEKSRFRMLEAEARQQLQQYSHDPYKSNDIDRADSTLLILNEIVNKEPKLKNSVVITSYTFTSLLKLDQCRAYEYGKGLLSNLNKNQNSDYIIEAIEWYDDKLDFGTEIYFLAAEAFQEKISGLVDSESDKLPRYYSEMANWYWRANESSKAIKYQERAIETLKSNEYLQPSDLTELESQLRRYRNGH